MTRRPAPDSTIPEVRRAYFARQSLQARKALQQIRTIVRAAVPAAVEHFSYGIPGFRLADRPLVWYAGFARHVSLYPIGVKVRRAHAAALAGYETSTGTVRFPLADGLPVDLVRALVEARAAEALAEAEARAKAAPRRATTKRSLGARKR